MFDENVSVLKGKTLTAVEQVDNEELYFHTSDGEKYRMFHYQGCCEVVYIEDIDGDLDTLVGSPLLMAEEVSSEDRPPLDEDDAKYGTYTWTFYKFATIKGNVTIRWYGTSNGYYSEDVDFERVSANG